MTAQLPALPIQKEQLLADIAHAEEKAATLCGPCADDHARLAGYLRALLSGMEQEPVTFTSDRALSEVYCGETSMMGPNGSIGDVPLYAAPVISEQPAYKAAIATLEHLGYTYHGGEMWKPPLGPAPNFSLIDQLHAEIDALKEQLGSYPAQIVDSDKILSDICDLFKIGEDARTRSAIMTNIENINDFADKLHAIEREFFMVPGEPDDDYPDEEPADECLVNCWGTTTEQYVEQFRAALKSLSAPVAVPECFQRLLKHSHGMSMGVDWNNGTSAGFHREKLLEAVKDCRAAMLNGG